MDTGIIKPYMHPLKNKYLNIYLFYSRISTKLSSLKDVNEVGRETSRERKLVGNLTEDGVSSQRARFYKHKTILKIVMVINLSITPGNILVQ